MSGGLSHIDSFDPKPRLQKEAGEPMPFETARTMFNQDGNIWPSPWEFHNYGEAGIPVSDLFPHIAGCADDIAVIRSMTARFMEHAQANFYFHCGQPFTGFPSMGAWTTYGLGAESQDLPGFVVMGSGGIPLGGINMFSSGFLPAVHQGSFLHPDQEQPLANVRPHRAPMRGSAGGWPSSARWTRGFWRAPERTPRSRRRSGTTRRRTACSRRCPSFATSAAKPKRRASCTASIRRTRPSKITPCNA